MFISLRLCFLLVEMGINYKCKLVHFCTHFSQAEKLRTPSLSKELCILSVIEILYLWKALPNCSTAKLQTMTQGNSIIQCLNNQTSLLLSLGVASLCFPCSSPAGDRRCFMCRPEKPAAWCHKQMSP